MVLFTLFDVDVGSGDVPLVETGLVFVAVADVTLNISNNASSTINGMLRAAGRVDLFFGLFIVFPLAFSSRYDNRYCKLYHIGVLCNWRYFH